MVSISYENQRYQCHENESVLETFLRNGVNAPFSCKKGVCQACLQRCTNVRPPVSATKNIKPALIEKNYFLLCQCVPEEDMDIDEVRPEDILTRAVLAEKEQLSDKVFRLFIEPATQIYYHPGQFINLHGADEIIRSYSLASVPTEDYYLELQVKRVTNGLMSNWLFDRLEVGDEIEFHGPLGDCYYRTEFTQRNILLISTGTGLSPHIGIVRDALNSGHAGSIYLYHASSDEQGHYLRSLLAELASKYANFKYYLTTSSPVIDKHVEVISGNVSQIAFDHHNDINGWLVYLSGNPGMVSGAQQLALKHGSNKKLVFSDPFEYACDLNDDPEIETPGNKHLPQQVIDEKRKFPDPDPEMWAALEEGKLMTEILTTFYSQVFEDELLSPYFAGVTRDRLIEKVYNFHYQMFTGEKVYFGERPRNAHHWMVIPIETFEYREKLMRQSLRKHGLAEHLVERWMAYEELYRDDVVKYKPINKILFGEEIPYEGFDSLVMDFSTLCDSCQGEISKGDTVRYHVRMGTTYCRKCTSRTDQVVDSTILR